MYAADYFVFMDIISTQKRMKGTSLGVYPGAGYNQRGDTGIFRYYAGGGPMKCSALEVLLTCLCTVEKVGQLNKGYKVEHIRLMNFNHHFI